MKISATITKLAPSDKHVFTFKQMTNRRGVYCINNPLSGANKLVRFIIADGYALQIAPDPEDYTKNPQLVIARLSDEDWAWCTFLDVVDEQISITWGV